MDSASDSDPPIPTKRTVIADQRLQSPHSGTKDSVQSPRKPLQRSARQSRPPPSSLDEQSTQSEISAKPKPKPRTFSPPAVASTSMAGRSAADAGRNTTDSGRNTTDSGKSTADTGKSTAAAEFVDSEPPKDSKPKKLKSFRRQMKAQAPELDPASIGTEKRASRQRHGSEAGSQASAPNDPPDEVTGNGDAGTGLRIRDILQAFQDDVVTVKSSQRNKWQEKMDEIQSQFMFPELEQRKGDIDTSVTRGWDRRASVPSKWKSAASLIPHDRSGDDEAQRLRSSHASIFKFLSNGLNCLSFYSSGILCGLTLWKALFAISQMLANATFDLSQFFWILFWTVTTLLLLVTILGFLNTRFGEVTPSASVLRFIPCILIISTYYLSKAFDLQRSECQKYLEAEKKGHDLHNIHKTYDCDPSQLEAGAAWNESNYWKISVDLIPALGVLIIHTFLHFRVHHQSAFFGSAASLSTVVENTA